MAREVIRWAFTAKDWVRFVADKVAMGHFFSVFLRFPLPRSHHSPFSLTDVTSWHSSRQPHSMTSPL
jgi:hypothetical protein